MNYYNITRITIIITVSRIMITITKILIISRLKNQETKNALNVESLLEIKR